jgi:hypothetical protein
MLSSTIFITTSMCARSIGVSYSSILLKPLSDFSQTIRVHRSTVLFSFTKCACEDFGHLPRIDKYRYLFLGRPGIILTARKAMRILEQEAVFTLMMT